MKEILKEALKEISFSKKDERRLFIETKRFVGILSKYIGKKIFIGGSLAKGTMIKKNKQDVDLFVIFEDENETKELEKYLKKTKLNYEIFHGSRDYFQIEYKNVLFEIVPLVRIKKKESVKNVTDFSPLHVDYIKKKLRKNPSLKNEIKLAKSFCQAQEIYGAESYIKGFSGYAIEVLICYYQSFLNFLRKIQKDDFVDIEKHFRNKKEALREINEQKILSPLILIDPVYKYRNLCAGLSKESFEVLLKKAKDFLKKPSLSFFIKKEFDEKLFLKKAKESKTTSFILNLYSSRVKEDIAATKMKKFFDFLKKELEKKEQKVLDSKFVFLGERRAKAYFSVIIKEKIKVFGPREEMKDCLEKFRKKRKKIFFEGGRAFAYEKFTLKDFLEIQKKVAESMGVFFEEGRPGEDSNL